MIAGYIHSTDFIRSLCLSLQSGWLRQSNCPDAFTAQPDLVWGKEQTCPSIPEAGHYAEGASIGSHGTDSQDCRNLHYRRSSSRGRTTPRSCTCIVSAPLTVQHALVSLLNDHNFALWPFKLCSNVYNHCALLTYYRSGN